MRHAKRTKNLRFSQLHTTYTFLQQSVHNGSQSHFDTASS